MKNAPLRHRLEYAAYWSFKRFLLLLPHASTRRVGQWLGQLAHLVVRKERRVALENMSLALPEMDDGARRHAVQRCFRHMGAAVCETISTARFDNDGLLGRVDAQGVEHLAAAEAAGKGVLLVTGHYGYWEIAALRLALELRRLNIVYRPLDNPYVDREVAEIRDRVGVELIGKRSSGTRILRALKRGEAVGLLPDQRVIPQFGIEVPFLGVPAWTTTLPAALALRTGAPVLPIVCLPLAGGRYQLSIGAPLDTATELEGDAAVAELTQRLSQPLEARIRDDPGLWLWMHRRWRWSSASA